MQSLDSVLALDCSGPNGWWTQIGGDTTGESLQFVCDLPRTVELSGRALLKDFARC
jgi:hypothetical protein